MATQLLNIQGVDVEVMNYDFSKKELDLDSGRNLDGIMSRNILAHHPRTIDVVFPPMNRNEMHYILNLIDRPHITVRAFDIFTNNIETIDMMHGDLNPSLYWNPDDMLYNSFKVQLVEY